MARIARWIAATAAVMLVPAVSAFAAEPDPPTATFVGQGAPPLTCGSRPDVRSLTVPADAHLLVINEIDVDATVVVDSAALLRVPDGGAALLTLTPGQHVVTMVPACLRHAAIKELTVTVVAGAEVAASPSEKVPSIETTPVNVPPTDVPPTDVPPANVPHSEGPHSEGPPANVPHSEVARSGDGAVTPTEPTRPSASTSVSPPATGAAGPDAERPEITATLVDLGRGESLVPRLVSAAAVIVILGLAAAVVPAFVRLWRAVVAARRRRAQLAGSRRRARQSDEGAGSTHELRDRLRELVQASHLGADPGEIAAVRAELFAQNPRPDEPAGTRPPAAEGE